MGADRGAAVKLRHARDDAVPAILGFAVAGLLPVVVLLATVGAQIYWISLAREFRRLMNDRSGADAPLAQLSA